MIAVRRAETGDEDGILAVIEAANAHILPLHFADRRIVEASRAIMSLDRALIRDGTYFVAEEAGAVLGCGGWSRRATLYGGDKASGRDDTPLDPATQAAKIRAMYTHPDHLRRGIGRMILRAAEAAAAREGFRRAEMGATLAGVPLYRALGYAEVGPMSHEVAGVHVPLVHMARDLAP